ncbi:MAG: helix-turn-helix transcriptional regulator [Granulosicoccaceae bacterium]|jgi:DNA-binding XRE family transcriptional regulator
MNATNCRTRQWGGQFLLAELTGIPQSTISAIENDRVAPGVERAKVLACALLSDQVPEYSQRSRYSGVYGH